ncbi:MAG: hypothetical protein Fur007_18150 [Rhodoferax sp.]
MMRLTKGLLQPLRLALIVGVLTLAAGSFWLRSAEQNRQNTWRSQVYRLAQDHAQLAQNHIDHALSATFALQAMVLQAQGRTDRFDEVARQLLPNYPGVSILILAPDGVIRHAIPLEGNEGALGLDLLQDPIMRAEAQLAQFSGRLTLAGPLPLRQGGEGLIVQLPIFLPDASQQPRFWGLANVVLRLPKALDGLNLHSLSQRGLAYELWRVVPETGAHQTIAQSQAGALTNPVHKSFSVPNGAWTLSISPIQGWGDPAWLGLRAASVGLLALLLGYLTWAQTRLLQNRRLLTQQVAERTADIAATLDALPDLLFEMDLQGTYLTCHAPRSDLLVAPVEALLGRKAADVLPPEVNQVLLEALAEAHTRGQSTQRQYRLALPTGDRWFELSVARKAVPKGSQARCVVIARDITDSREAQQRIQHLAYFDALTQLPNRALLEDRLHHALADAARRQEPLCMMFLDLDHFKNINDTLGHRVGDQLLVQVAQRMGALLREQDTVARLGGDEFILLLPDTGAEAAARVAQRLLHEVSRPLRLDDQELSVTPSMGLAIYPHNGRDADTLLRHADTAMYRAKRNGRNGYQFYAETMQADATRALFLGNELRRVLERHQLSLHYQPQFSLADGQVKGVEALLRWQHPELGAISPGEFIPLAESSGQILTLGHWVLREAVRQARDWLDAGLPPLTMAVNLSAVQFRQPNLVERVAQVLHEAQLPAELLELELTESVAQQDPKTAVQTMTQLSALGVRLSIDDFGTGYSSLSYLKQFSAHQLKIDQSFVRDLTDDPDDLVIVRAIISMARRLGLSTLAEGVETLPQLERLREEGCDEVQGYLFSRPLPAPACFDFLVEHMQVHQQLRPPQPPHG